MSKKNKNHEDKSKYFEFDKNREQRVDENKEGKCSTESDALDNENSSECDCGEGCKCAKKGCEKEVKAELEAMGIKGVVYEKDTKRSYPTGTTAAQTIGFIRDVSWGIEKYYGKYMEGTPGRSFITYDSTGNVNAVEMDAKDGSTVVTTLDYIIQQYAEDAVKQAMESYNPENAAVMVMNPNTGEILAMAQGPTFDPNDPATPIYLDNEEFKEKWEAMSDDEKYEYLNGTWKNFNVSSTYEPGSIFKPITAAAALEEGLIEPNATFYCSGSTIVADRMPAKTCFFI